MNADIAALCTRMSWIDIDPDREETETVYVLLHGNEIVYVGRTVDVANRVDFHRNGSRRWPAKVFDRALCLELLKRDAAACEGALIRRFNPRLTHGSPNNESRDAEILAWFGLQPDISMRDAFIQKRASVFVESHRKRRARKARRRLAEFKLEAKVS